MHVLNPSIRQSAKAQVVEHDEQTSNYQVLFRDPDEKLMSKIHAVRELLSLVDEHGGRGGCCSGCCVVKEELSQLQVRYNALQQHYMKLDETVKTLVLEIGYLSNHRSSLPLDKLQLSSSSSTSSTNSFSNSSSSSSSSPTRLLIQTSKQPSVRFSLTEHPSRASTSSPVSRIPPPPSKPAPSRSLKSTSKQPSERSISRQHEGASAAPPSLSPLPSRPRPLNQTSKQPLVRCSSFNSTRRTSAPIHKLMSKSWSLKGKNLVAPASTAQPTSLQIKKPNTQCGSDETVVVDKCLDSTEKSSPDGQQACSPPSQLSSSSSSSRSPTPPPNREHSTQQSSSKHTIGRSVPDTNNDAPLSPVTLKSQGNSCLEASAGPVPTSLPPKDEPMSIMSDWQGFPVPFDEFKDATMTWKLESPIPFQTEEQPKTPSIENAGCSSEGMMDIFGESCEPTQTNEQPLSELFPNLDSPRQATVPSVPLPAPLSPHQQLMSTSDGQGIQDTSIPPVSHADLVNDPVEADGVESDLEGEFLLVQESCLEEQQESKAPLPSPPAQPDLGPMQCPPDFEPENDDMDTSLDSETSQMEEENAGTDFEFDCSNVEAFVEPHLSPTMAEF